MSGRIAVLAVMMIGLVACGDPPPEPLPLTDAELRARTKVIYPSVDMYKPVAGEGEEFDVYQAPMFYREHPEGEPSIDQDAEFARLVFAEGDVQLDLERPAVYVHTTEVSHGAIPHKQVTFLWFLRPRGTEGIRAQGLRMTYDSSGYPAIFEVLTDASGKSLYYVSESLEKLAVEQHGAALVGRTFSVEPDPDEASQQLVIRLVKQGAQPLGPLVYDGFEGSDILQLHCRCASSQLKAIGSSVNYELIGIGTLTEGERSVLAAKLGWGDSAADLGFPAPIWPFASLRLPDAF